MCLVHLLLIMFRLSGVFRYIDHLRAETKRQPQHQPQLLQEAAASLDHLHPGHAGSGFPAVGLLKNKIELGRPVRGKSLLLNYFCAMGPFGLSTEVAQPACEL